MTDGVLDDPLNITHNDIYRSGGGDTIANGAIDADPPTLYPVSNAMSGFDSNSLSSDPQFNSDFKLKSGSPCINAGTDPFSNGDGNQYDYNGLLVWDDVLDSPVGMWRGGVDIGAYAYTIGGSFFYFFF